MTQRTSEKVQKICDLIHDKAPTSLEDFKKLGIKMKFLADGLYRSVYRVNGVPLVIKIPNGKSGRVHARKEYSAVSRIRRFKKYRELVPYMSVIEYFDKTTGVMVMEFYSRNVSAKSRHAIARLFSHVIKLTWPYAKIDTVDIHSENIGFDESGCPKIIDLGYFAENS